MAASKVELTETLRLYYKPMVEKAASSAHRSAFFISKEDLEQELWIWLMEQGHTYFIRRAQRMQDNGEGDFTDGHKTAILTRKARSFAARELVDYREFNGDWLYQYDEVLNLLKNCEGGNLDDIEGHVDILEAFGMLRRTHPRTALAVFKVYVAAEQVSDYTKVSASRGLRHLCHYMNDIALRNRAIS